MILLDLEDTLIDHSGAEEAAVHAFGERFGDAIPRYDAAGFLVLWRVVAAKHMAAFLSRDISYQEQRRRRMRDIFGDPGLADAVCDERFGWYLAHYEHSLRVFDDVVPFLDHHSDRKIAVLSNGSQRHQELILDYLGIRPRLAFVLTAEQAGCAKPDPRIFRLACERLGAPPAQVAYIGDDLYQDGIAAKAAGLRGVWLNRHGRSQPHPCESIASLEQFEAQRRPASVRRKAMAS